MASNPPTRAVHRSVKTCTQCKQVKLRCDSKERFPAPCTRCQTRGLQCVVDSAFRRTPARKRVEEMAKELEVLRNQRREDNPRNMTTSPSMPDSTQDSPDTTSDHAGSAVVSDTELIQDHFQLEDYVVDKDFVVDVFKIFCAFYYPHFPVLDPQISISALYDSSPLLFWTIIAITTSRAILPSHQALHEPLREPFMRQFQSEVLHAPLPLQTIQAIVYLSIFPFPVRHQNADPSWLYSGVALNAAMYMGLHRAKPAPSLRSIGVVAGSSRDRARTWLGCFLANNTLAKFTGVSSPIRGSADLATIEQYIRAYPVSPEFAYQVMTQHTLAKFFNTIVENSQEHVSHSLINIIDAELDGLRARFPTPWTSRVELANLTAKMMLYTTVSIQLQSDRTSRDILLRNGLTTAVRIVYLTDQGLTYESPDFPNIPQEKLQGTLPKNYFRILVLATAFLLRFFVLNNKATPEEAELARNHVAIAQRFLKAGSSDPLDERVRGAALFEVLSRQKPVDLGLSKLRVDDRMGASLFYDAVTAGHELRRLPVEVEESSPSNTSSGVDRTREHATEFDFDDTAMDDMRMNGFDSLNFSLPEDIWGDSVWSMFDSIQPSFYPTDAAPGPGEY